MNNRWTKFDPVLHKELAKDARPVYVVTGQIKDRKGLPEILGAEYLPTHKDPTQLTKHKCEHFKVVCSLGSDNKLHITGFTERFGPGVFAPKRSIVPPG